MPELFCENPDHHHIEREATVSGEKAIAICCDTCGLALIKMLEAYTPTTTETVTINLDRLSSL